MAKEISKDLARVAGSKVASAAAKEPRAIAAILDVLRHGKRKGGQGSVKSG